MHNASTQLASSASPPATVDLCGRWRAKKMCLAGSAVNSRPPRDPAAFASVTHVDERTRVCSGNSSHEGSNQICTVRCFARSLQGNAACPSQCKMPHCCNLHAGRTDSNPGPQGLTCSTCGKCTESVRRSRNPCNSMQSATRLGEAVSLHHKGHIQATRQLEVS